MNLNVTTEFAGLSDSNVLQTTIRVLIDGAVKFIGTFDSEAEAFQEAQEWLDEQYPDNEVVL